MLCYFISKKDLSIINCIESNSFSVSHNLDIGGKTKIIVAGNPNASDEDFVILKDGKTTKFQGIVESIYNADGELKYEISCLEIERIFDRQIILSDVELIKNTGIEDFLVQTIKKYFSQSDDSFINMQYLKCTALTHTKTNSKPLAENEIYNLKTYIGNAKEQYGIFMDFEFTSTSLNVSIYKKEQKPLQIDTTITDVISCIETYKVQVLSKLSVVWFNSLTEKKTIRNFYLHPDRSVSEENKDRVIGTISTIYIDAETEEEMIEAAKNEFKSNSYSHSVETEIIASSKLYPANELYVGHEALIKTSAAGVKESIISEISFTEENDIIFVKFGILKVTFTDKMKGALS